MSSTAIAALNERFGRADRLRFGEGNGGLPKLELEFAGACAEIYLQGAHVTRYRPAGHREVLWLSDSARYAPGVALRGGIPLCWPWFGAGDNGRPQHGYARNSEFTPQAACADHAMTAVVLALDAAATPYPDWRGRLQLELEIRLADSLWMELRSRNLAAEAVVISNALHGYFAISRRDRIRIPALTGLAYLDKLQDYRELPQSDAFVLDTEVDRVYQYPPTTIQLIDRDWRRVTSIECWGNNNLVVWNPGAHKAAAMADFDAAGFEHMVCIEPANAASQSVVLQTGETHRLGQQITLGGTG